MTVSAVSYHTCALKVGGAVKCWGGNNAGQLGNGLFGMPSSAPVDVVGLSTGVAAIALGGEFSCALMLDGSVKCWGSNQYGQLGSPEAPNSPTPVDVLGLGTGVKAIAAGTTHACAVTSNGGAKCWGRNFEGKLGDGSFEGIRAPVDVVGLDRGIVAIAPGERHTCALSPDGGVKCWVANVNGQLGDGTKENRYRPVDVVGLDQGARTITVGASHSCALMSLGGVKCWGDTFDENALEPATTPIDELGLGGGVTAISAGGWHTCALLTDGSIKCWGANSKGQLGDGTTTLRSTPVEVVGLEGRALSMSAGAVHTCAVMLGGGIKCWGRNNFGLLGDGTTIDRSTPVNVIGL